MFFIMKSTMISAFLTFISLTTMTKCTIFHLVNQNQKKLMDAITLWNKSSESSIELTQRDRMLYVKMALHKYLVSMRQPPTPMIMKVRDILTNCSTKDKYAKELSTGDR